jgi:hypothetical protein
MEKKEVRTIFLISYKNNSKWIEDLNGRPETTKVLEDSLLKKCFRTLKWVMLFWTRPQKPRKEKQS